MTLYHHVLTLHDNRPDGWVGTCDCGWGIADLDLEVDAVAVAYSKHLTRDAHPGDTYEAARMAPPPAGEASS